MGTTAQTHIAEVWEGLCLQMSLTIPATTHYNTLTIAFTHTFSSRRSEVVCSLHLNSLYFFFCCSWKQCFKLSSKHWGRKASSLFFLSCPHCLSTCEVSAEGKKTPEQFLKSSDLSCHLFCRHFASERQL